MSKEHNFISAVVYFNGDADTAIRGLEKISLQFEEHFMQYEIIIVNNSRDRDAVLRLKQWGEKKDKPITIINMSMKQSMEQCMNAGIDITIGDYIYEFDSIEMPYEESLIWQAYETAMMGNDIVTCRPDILNGLSRIFYKIFNSHSGAAYPLGTDAFRLVSRRALNRAHAISTNLPYRKATYATSGLKMAEIKFHGRLQSKEDDNRLELAIDSLVIYTDFVYRVSISLAILMMLVAIAECAYTVAVWLGGNPVSGWTTTMFVLTAGLVGIFAVLSLAIKYLSLILRFTLKKQSYLIESIEKI